MCFWPFFRSIFAHKVGYFQLVLHFKIFCGLRLFPFGFGFWQKCKHFFWTSLVSYAVFGFSYNLVNGLGVAVTCVRCVRIL